MAKKRKKRTPFAVNKEGDQLFVEVQALMHMLVPYIDGLPVTFFGKKSGKAYLDIDTAIAWLEKECRENPPFAKEGGDMKLKACQLAKEKFIAGQVVEN